MGQTVNLLTLVFGGSNPSLPTFILNSTVEDFFVLNCVRKATRKESQVLERQNLALFLIMQGALNCFDVACAVHRDRCVHPHEICIRNHEEGWCSTPLNMMTWNKLLSMGG
jgi:hypothetical protein